MGNTPSYDGKGLVNLIAEIEQRLTGSSPSPGLSEAGVVPDGSTYVLVLFDGLGEAQLGHPHARGFKASMADVIEAPFPSTTSVSLATVATGLPPALHGQVAHLTWMPELRQVVNCLKWVNLSGEPVTYDYPSLLPSPNLWERLRSAGVEPITVQPGDFNGSPLSRALYRGARFEAAWDVDDLAEATAHLAGRPGRFIFTYVPYVDFAGHVWGLASDEFTEAMRLAASVWDRIASALPPGAVLLGTADHGLKEFEESNKLIIRDNRFDALRFAGDSRGIHLWGEPDLIGEFVSLTGGDLVDPWPLLGPEPAEVVPGRISDKILLAPPDLSVHPRGFDKRLRCYHGGLTTDEMNIPILVG